MAAGLAACFAAGGALGADSKAPMPLKTSDFAAKHSLKEIRFSTASGVAALLAPYAGDTGQATDPAVAHALEVLRANRFTGHVSPPAPQKGLVDKLGNATMLGVRKHDMLPQLASLNDALPEGQEEARDAVLALWEKAGRKPPSDADLDKIVSDAASARGDALGPPQDGDVLKDGNDIQIESSPAVGLTRVSVIVPNGANNEPERVTFSGRGDSAPDKNGSDLDYSIVPDEPRDVTAQAARDLRRQVNGKWTDQDGNRWEVSGEGDSITFTSMTGNSHRMEYTGQWYLGLPTATHLVNDPLDMNDGLPDDVKASLASSYHPPFTLRLEYLPDEGKFEGVWISGQVTYSGMTHDISMVEDPTWDKPLELRRDDDWDKSWGARDEERL